MLGVLSRPTESHQSAFVRRIRLAREDFVCDVHGHFAVLRWVDPIIHEWRSKRPFYSSVAGSRSKRCPVADQHCRRDDERLAIRRILAKSGALITAKEKQFVFENRSAESSAELVAFESASSFF